MIDYIKNMPIDAKSFNIVEYLIKEFRIAILYCFEPFYKKISDDINAKMVFEN